MSAPVSWEIFFGFIIFALVFAPLERCFPFHRQSAFRPGWTTDVFYYVVGCFVGHLSDTASLGVLLIIRRLSGLNFEGVAATQPGCLQFFEILIIADFLAYLYHRALHRNAYLWRLHRVHHSSEQMDWLANVRLHPLDKLGGDCFQFVPIFCLGFAEGPLLAYTIFLGFQGFLNHSNIKLNYGPLRWVIASPQFHHWHHCDDPKAYDKNFSPHLVIFDLLFGTIYLPPDASVPDKYGVPDPVPDGFWRQMIYPLQRTTRETDAETGRSFDSGPGTLSS
jgi:sterol desaturase/sphingolipid hydroxylase (fatty acid hydroxylase superfamily)